MTKSLDHIMGAIPATRMKRIEKRGQELVAAELTLQQLRKELNLTQDAIAELLDMKQANVSKVEKRSDMLVSSLRHYIEAMGGSLELIARLPGRGAVKLEGFSDLNADA